MKISVSGAYRRLRRLLPDGEPVRYAQLPTSMNKKLGDDLVPRSFLPFMNWDIPDYEAGLIRGLRANLRPGDRVVIVGGGEGVTALIAANLVGPSGAVTVFEGSQRQLQRMRTTWSRNGSPGHLDMRHAIVGENIGVYGGEEASTVVAASELPACDVLELDCEGAELKILAEIKMRPRTILVETHGVHGAPTAQVAELLKRLGYAVEDLGLAEPDRLADCEAGDIRVLQARLSH